MAAGLNLTGLVLWREDDAATPSFQYGTLIIDNGKCVSLTKLPEPNRVRTFVVPGFVDMHAHLAIGSGIASSDQIKEHAWSQIKAGVLVVREPGSPVKVSEAELPFGRPIVVSAGRHIAVERRYIRGFAVELPADDSEVRVVEPYTESVGSEVKRQAKSGDGWVKLVGDWIDRSEGPESDLEPLWSGEQLAEAVRAAHEVDAKVAVHIFGARGLDDVLESGVDTIEHGSGLTPEQMRVAAENGTVVVPTLLQVLKFPEFAASATRYPKYAQTMTALYEGRREWFEALLESGVQILPGSDAGGFQSHGALVREMRTMAEWGMEPQKVLASATWEARDFLGLPSLSPGAPADAVIFSSDPRRDPVVWGQPKFVIANGHIIYVRLFRDHSEGVNSAATSSKTARAV